MPRPHGALQRSLSAMTIGVVKAQQSRDVALAPTQLSELVQHNQLRISGKVGEKPLTRVATVTWPYPFVYAPAQRDSNFTNPHFNYGVEYGEAIPTSATPIPTDHPLIHVAVVNWLSDDNAFSTGADVAITAWIPSAKKKRQFSALAHLTFWGYGAPAEDDGADTTGVEN